LKADKKENLKLHLFVILSASSYELQNVSYELWNVYVRFTFAMFDLTSIVA